jgi:hypothetical protein
MPFYRRPFSAFAIGSIVCLLATACGGSPSVMSPTSSSGNPPTVTGTGSTTITYVKDIQPILAGDCVACHGPAIQQLGVNLRTYDGVLKVVTVGNSNSLLIQVTQPGGLMNGMLTGNRTQKIGTIYDWVMTSNAAQQ